LRIRMSGGRCTTLRSRANTGKSFGAARMIVSYAWRRASIGGRFSSHNWR
jgi:hypothetical protein